MTASTPATATKPRLDLTFTVGTPVDAAALASVGARAFPAGHPVSPDDIAAYVNTHFTPEAMARDLQDAGRTFFVARDGGRAIGFAVMKANNPNKTKADADKEAAEGKVVGETPPEILRPHGIEVQRIYTDPAYHGTGAARALMEHTLQQARARGFRYAWLGAWERNSRALAFYSKFGFSSVGAQGVWVGEDLHRDEIMVREL